MTLGFEIRDTQGRLEPTARLRLGGGLKLTTDSDDRAYISFGFDVKAFGAVGDGITDDTAAIQAAIDAAASTGGIAFIPDSSADYVLTSGLTISGGGVGNRVQLMGAGWNSVLRWEGAAGGHMLTVEDSFGGVILSNFRMRGNSTARPASAIRLLQTNGSFPNQWNRLENILLGTIGGGDGIVFDDGILVAGTVQNAETLYNNVKIDGASRAGYYQESIQNLVHVFNGLYVTRCAAGMHVAGSVSVQGAVFAFNTVDLELPLQDDSSNNAIPRVYFNDFHSENAGRWMNILGSAVIGVQGGFWQITNNINADGKIIICENNSNQTISIRDFRFFQVAGYVGPPPLMSVKSLAAGASVKQLVLDGIRDLSLLTGGVDVNTQGSTDRRYVYVRELETTTDTVRESVNILQGRPSLNYDENRQSFEGFMEGAEIADPAAPAAPTGAGRKLGRFYFRDNGAGKTQLVVRFQTGAIQVLATEP